MASSSTPAPDVRLLCATSTCATACNRPSTPLTRSSFVSPIVRSAQYNKKEQARYTTSARTSRSQVSTPSLLRMISFIQGSKRPRVVPSSALHPAATPPADGTNLLASLPREQIDEVLRRLPIKDAIRTSALATAWRNCWKTCPHLKLVFFSDDPLGVVDSVLNKYTCCVDVFEVHFTREYICRLEGWLHVLSAKGVRSIELYFVPATVWEDALVPNSLFMCTGITKLLLVFCKLPPLPSTFQGFPQLEHLHLREVIFLNNGEMTFEALISKSPSLRTLGIQFPRFEGYKKEHIYREWVIQAPKLEDISIRSDDDCGWQIIDLPSLVTANVELQGPQITRILSGITNVQKLYMDFTDDTILEQLPSFFVDLKYLSFHTTFTQSSRILSIFSILRNAPNLEDLEITIWQEEDEDIEVDMEFLNAQPSVGLFPKLKYFNLHAIVGQSNEMQFIEFVLSKAARLEKIEVFVCDDMRWQTMKKLPHKQTLSSAASMATISRDLTMRRRNLKAYDDGDTIGQICKGEGI
ncbi:hypothetical protein EJB05_24084, partial [Eragrostis curvula]